MCTFLALVLAAGLAAVALTSCGDDGPDWTEQAGGAAWVVTSSLRPEDTTIALRVAIGSSSCNRLADVEVVETDEEVRLRAVVESAADAEVCTSDLAMRPTTAQLATPLCDRTLAGCIDPEQEGSSAFGRPEEVGCEVPTDAWPR